MILLPVVNNSYLTEHKLQSLWQFTNKLIQWVAFCNQLYFI
jgi:hypothetical protein